MDHQQVLIDQVGGISAAINSPLPMIMRLPHDAWMRSRSTSMSISHQQRRRYATPPPRSAWSWDHITLDCYFVFEVDQVATAGRDRSKASASRMARAGRSADSGRSWSCSSGQKVSTSLVEALPRLLGCRLICQPSLRPKPWSNFWKRQSVLN